MSEGAGHRIIAAVEMLRSLRSDGFDVSVIVEIALDPFCRHELPVEERAAILEIYRQSIAKAAGIAPPPPLFEPVPVAANAAVFSNFVERWPDPMGSQRGNIAFEWRKLSALEQADAIASIPGWMALRRNGRFSDAGPATLYLRDRSWHRIPVDLPPYPQPERTEA